MADMYMHLLNDKPAQFYEEVDGGRLGYPGKQLTRFATSLRQVRREQQASKRFYRDDNDRYDYIRVARAALRR